MGRRGLLVLGVIAGCGETTSTSPLGKLAYVKDAEIWIADGESENHAVALPPEDELGPVDRDGASPVWLDDGSRLFFRVGFSIAETTGTASSTITSFDCELTSSVSLSSQRSFLAIEARGIERVGSNGDARLCTWLMDVRAAETFRGGGERSTNDGSRIVICSTPNADGLRRLWLRNIRTEETLWEAEHESCPVLSHKGEWIASIEENALTLQDPMLKSPPTRFEMTEAREIYWAPDDSSLLLGVDGQRWSVVGVDDPTTVLVATDGQPLAQDHGPTWSADASRVLVPEDCGEGRHQYVLLDIDAGSNDVWASRCERWLAGSLSPAGDRIVLSNIEDGVSRVLLAGPGYDEETVLDEGHSPTWRPLPAGE